VVSVEVVPGRFDVRPGSTFELRAKLKDASGAEIPEFYSYRPQWTVRDGGKGVIVRSAVGHSVVIEVPISFTDLDDFDVIVEARPGVGPGQASGNVVLTSRVGDGVDADHSLDQLLEFGLGGDGAPDTWTSPVAFAGIGQLGNFNSATGGMFVFSADHAMAYFPVISWIGGDQYAAYQAGAPAPGQSPQLPLVKDINIWIDRNAGDDQWPITTTEAVMRIHAADASRTFARNRTGFRFNVKSVNVITSSPPTHGDCTTLSTMTAQSMADGSDATYADAAEAIDVFVVGGMGNGTGESCQYDIGPTKGYRVFLNANQVLPNVMAHELGHIFLTMSGPGDHGAADLIGPTNLLVSGDDDRTPRRYGLSLGQACLMNRSIVGSRLRTDASLQTPALCPPIGTGAP
jgi:hypothetical protein